MGRVGVYAPRAAQPGPLIPPLERAAFAFEGHRCVCSTYGMTSDYFLNGRANI